jgi:hypothetical protein
MLTSESRIRVGDVFIKNHRVKLTVTSVKKDSVLLLRSFRNGSLGVYEQIPKSHLLHCSLYEMIY